MPKWLDEVRNTASWKIAKSKMRPKRLHQCLLTQILPTMEKLKLIDFQKISDNHYPSFIMVECDMPLSMSNSSVKSQTISMSPKNR